MARILPLILLLDKDWLVRKVLLAMELKILPLILTPAEHCPLLTLTLVVEEVSLAFVMVV